jgi:hypothetical protein
VHELFGEPPTRSRSCLRISAASVAVGGTVHVSAEVGCLFMSKWFIVLVLMGMVRSNILLWIATCACAFLSKRDVLDIRNIRNQVNSV